MIEDIVAVVLSMSGSVGKGGRDEVKANYGKRFLSTLSALGCSCQAGWLPNATTASQSAIQALKIEVIIRTQVVVTPMMTEVANQWS